MPDADDPSLRVSSSLSGYVVSQITSSFELTYQLAVEISSDVIVTGTIAYCLWTSRTGWSGTDRLIGRLLRYVHPSSLQAKSLILSDSSSRLNSHLPYCKSPTAIPCSVADQISVLFFSSSSSSPPKQAPLPVSSCKSHLLFDANEADV